MTLSQGIEDINKMSSSGKQQMEIKQQETFA